MAASGEVVEGIEVPAGHSGLPQMDASHFPGQIFWLVVTFGLLMVVMSRVALPRVAGGITNRTSRISGDLGAADTARKNAQAALAAYEKALADARSRALQLADENRKRLIAELDKTKAAADAEAQRVTAEAEARITAGRAKAATGVRAAAADAAVSIVDRLIGVSVPSNDAAAVVDIETKRG